jgi:spore germination cell wall hydrolase CwlJ-like protein
MQELEIASACLGLVLFGESGSNFHNQMAVYNVVMNRSDHKIEKVCDVVYEPKQFEYITLIQQKKAKEPNQEEFLRYKLLAVKFLTKANGYTYNPIGHAQFFHDDRISPQKNIFKKPLIAQVNNLYFY